MTKKTTSSAPKPQASMSVWSHLQRFASDPSNVAMIFLFIVIAITVEMILGGGWGRSCAATQEEYEHLLAKIQYLEQNGVSMAEYKLLLANHEELLKDAKRNCTLSVNRGEQLLKKSYLNTLLQRVTRSLDVTATEMVLIRSAIRQAQHKKLSRQDVLKPMVELAQEMRGSQKEPIRDSVLKDEKVWNKISSIMSSMAAEKKLGVEYDGDDEDL